MNHKVLGTVLVLAIALGVGSVTVRTPQQAPSPAPGAITSGEAAPPKAPDRPLACYKVYEKGIVDGMDYNGSGYQARVSASEVQFGAKDEVVRFGTPRVEQGSYSETCVRGTFSRPGFGVARLERGPVTEEYVFENTRMEQLFRVDRPLGEGAFRVSIPVESEFGGVIETRPPNSGQFEEIQFKNGGVAFRDAQGATRASYHSAIAIDALDQRIVLAPRYENGAIVLEVPADFMARAAYPVVIDPWLQLGGSASGGGISGTLASSDRPSIAVARSGNAFIAWSDNQVGNYEVYVKYWNGFEFKDLGGASFGAGLSANSGKSVNPQIILSSFGSTGTTANNGVPYVVWQDDTDGRVGVFFKRWNGVSLGWEELNNSASAGGLSASFIGPALYPQVASIQTFVNKLKLPAREATPLIVWEEGGEIHAYWHYPGDDQVVQGQRGWYSLGALTNHFSTGGSAGAPSLAIDLFGRPVISWHDTASGNFEIYAARYQDLATPGNPFVLSIDPFVGPQLVTPGLAFTDFGPVGLNGSNVGGGISNTPTQFSQNPSVAVDGTNVTVAWEETTPGGATGTNAEIYAARNTGAGWAALGGSMSGGGVSASTGNSFHPSIDCIAGNVVVAWSDDTSGNPEIYLRRFVAGSSTAWEQIGVQGSAFPLLAGDTIAPPGGVSLTPNLSLAPQVRVDVFGNPTVIWADGAQGSLDIYMKAFSPNGPGTMTASVFATDLRQTLTDPVVDPLAVDLPVATGTLQTTLYFSAHVFTEPLTPAGTSLRLQVEVQEVGAAFTGTPTIQSLPTAPNGLAVVAYTGLSNRDYKWQARTMDQDARFSPYVQFATTGNVSFRINSANVGSGPVNNAPIVTGSASGKGSCGLLGLDAVALLGILGMIRRRRTSK
jgi:hypothetical protein